MPTTNDQAPPEVQEQKVDKKRMRESSSSGTPAKKKKKVVSTKKKVVSTKKKGAKKATKTKKKVNGTKRATKPKPTPQQDQPASEEPESKEQKPIEEAPAPDKQLASSEPNIEEEEESKVVMEEEEQEESKVVMEEEEKAEEKNKEQKEETPQTAEKSGSTPPASTATTKREQNQSADFESAVHEEEEMEDDEMFSGDSSQAALDPSKLDLKPDLKGYTKNYGFFSLYNGAPHADINTAISGGGLYFNTVKTEPVLNVFKNSEYKPDSSVWLVQQGSKPNEKGLRYRAKFLVPLCVAKNVRFTPYGLYDDKKSWNKFHSGQPVTKSTWTMELIPKAFQSGSVTALGQNPHAQEFFDYVTVQVTKIYEFIANEWRKYWAAALANPDAEFELRNFPHAKFMIRAGERYNDKYGDKEMKEHKRQVHMTKYFVQYLFHTFKPYLYSADAKIIANGPDVYKVKGKKAVKRYENGGPLLIPVHEGGMRIRVKATVFKKFYADSKKERNDIPAHLNNPDDPMYADVVNAFNEGFDYNTNVRVFDVNNNVSYVDWTEYYEKGESVIQEGSAVAPVVSIYSTNGQGNYNPGITFTIGRDIYRTDYIGRPPYKKNKPMSGIRGLGTHMKPLSHKSQEDSEEEEFDEEENELGGEDEGDDAGENNAESDADDDEPRGVEDQMEQE